MVQLGFALVTVLYHKNGYDTKISTRKLSSPPNSNKALPSTRMLVSQQQSSCYNAAQA